MATLDPCARVEGREELERRMGGVFSLDGSFASLWALERVLVAQRRVPTLAAQARWVVPYLTDLFEGAFEDMGMTVHREGLGRLRVSAPITYDVDVGYDVERMINMREHFPHFHGLRWVENRMLGTAMMPWYGLSTIFQNHAWAKTEHDAIGNQRDRMDRAVPWLTEAFVEPLNLAPEHHELALKVARHMVWPPLCYPTNDFGEHNRGRLIAVLKDAEPQQIRDILDAFVASQDRAAQMLAAITAIHFGVPPDNRHEACVYRDAIECFRLKEPPPFIVRSIDEYGGRLETKPHDADLLEYKALYEMNPAQGYAYGQKILARNAALPATQCTTGWHADRLGKKDEAMVHYMRSIEIKPDYAQPLINMGVVRSMQKDYASGDEHFFAAFALKPEDLDLSLNLLVNHLFALEEAASARPRPASPGGASSIRASLTPRALEEMVSARPDPVAPKDSSPIRDLLIRYGRKEISQNAAVRALVTHQDYLVPSFLMPPDHVAGRGIVFSQRQSFPGGALWVFTDEGAARRAQSQHDELGVYTTGQPSSVFLTDLVRDSFNHIRINPMGPEEEGFILMPPAVNLLNMWASGVRVERAAQAEDLSALNVAIVQHRGTMIALDRAGEVFVTQGDKGLVAYIAATPDQSDALSARLGDMVTMSPIPSQALHRALVNARVKQVRVEGAGGEYPVPLFG